MGIVGLPVQPKTGLLDAVATGAVRQRQHRHFLSPSPSKAQLRAILTRGGHQRVTSQVDERGAAKICIHWRYEITEREVSTIS